MFVLILGFMTMSGFVEPPATGREYPSLAACNAAGDEEVAKRPGTWNFKGVDYPFMQYRCVSK